MKTLRAGLTLTPHFHAHLSLPPHSLSPAGLLVPPPAAARHLPGASLSIVSSPYLTPQLGPYLTPYLNATCQFYNLKSKSVDGPGGVRRTLVTPPKGSAAARQRAECDALADGLSLVGYVVATKLTGGDVDVDVDADGVGARGGGDVLMDRVYPTAAGEGGTTGKAPTNSGLPSPTTTAGGSSSNGGVVTDGADHVRMERIYRERERETEGGEGVAAVSIDMVKLTVSDE